MAKKTTSGKKGTWMDIKPPKSSMDADYNLVPDHLSSPHEESWWDPGVTRDSRGDADGSGKGVKKQGSKKAVASDPDGVVDI